VRGEDDPSGREREAGHRNPEADARRKVFGWRRAEQATGSVTVAVTVRDEGLP